MDNNNNKSRFPRIAGWVFSAVFTALLLTPLCLLLTTGQDKVCLCIPVFGHGFGAQGDGGKGQFTDGQGHVPFHLEAEGVSL